MLNRLDYFSNQLICSIKRLFNDKRFVNSVAATFCVGFIAHGYVFTNLNLSHDSLNEFFLNPEWKIQLGRFISPLYTKLTGTICIYPWSNGLLGLFWVSLSVYLITKIFDVKNTFSIVALAMLLTVNKTITAIMATFTHEFSSYMFALLLSCFAAYIWKNKKNVVGFLTTVLLLTISMGIYQAYLATFLMLMVIYSIKELMINKDTKDSIIHGLIAILEAILSVIVYYVLFRITLKITGISPLRSGYNSVTNITGISSDLFINSYKLGLTELFLPSEVATNNYLFNALNGLLIVFILVTVYKKSNKKTSNLILITTLLLTIPFIVALMNFASGSYHDLMGYGIYIFISMSIILIDAFTLLNFNKIFVSFLVIAITFFNIQTANACYSVKEIQDKSTYFYMTDLVSKLEECPEYRKYDSKVAIIGYFFDDFQMKELKSLSLSGMDNVSGITYYDCWKSYFENVLNYPINLVSEQETIELASIEIVKNMPIFPYKDSIKMVDDVIVIKLQWAE